MSVVYRHGGNLLLLSKGAPERLLPRCTSLMLQKSKPSSIAGNGEEDSLLGEDVSAMSEKMHAKIRDMNRQLGSEGLRVLALAMKLLPDREKKKVRSEDDLPSREELEQDLIFVGLVGIEDPPREGVQASVAICQRAGIETKKQKRTRKRRKKKKRAEGERKEEEECKNIVFSSSIASIARFSYSTLFAGITVHMLTGDHPSTAFAIARAIGIVPEASAPPAPSLQQLESSVRFEKDF